MVAIPSSANRPSARMNSITPARKVSWSAFAGAVTAVVVWLLNAYVPEIFQGWVKIPPEISSALVVIVSFVTGYQVAPGNNEQIIHDQ
jgi:uncharacterized membrane protein YhdT